MHHPTRTIALVAICLGFTACVRVSPDSTTVIDAFTASTASPSVDVFTEYRITPGDELTISFTVGNEEQAEYRIQIQDEVEVKFVTLPEYDTIQIVRPDGRITLPFLGDVRVAKSTPAEATARIRNGYEGTLRVPDVYLSVKVPNAALNRLNESVSTEDSEGRSVVVRPDGRISLPAVGDMDAAGLTVATLSDNVNAVYRERYPHANVDVVLTNSIGATVSVFGEVGSPGLVPVTRPLLLYEAIAQAGGDTIDSELSTVVTMRREGDILLTRIIDLDAVLEGDEEAVMPIVQPGDLVYVPRTKLSTASNIMTQISAIIPYDAIIQGATIAIINDAINPN